MSTAAPPTPTDTPESAPRAATSEIDASVEHARRNYGRGGGWKTTALLSLVAAGAFAAGTYWGRDALRLAGLRAPADNTAAAKSDDKASLDKAATGPAVAANDDPNQGTATGLWTCSMHPQVILPAPGLCPICHMELTPLKASRPGDAASGAITIDPVVVQNMGVRTALVVRGPVIQSVRVVGNLEEPEPLHRDINLRVSGWIERLYANIDGMVITEGQPLFDLYSPELTVAIDEAISAHRQLKLAPQEDTAKALAEASTRKLLQFGLTEKQVAHLTHLDAAPRTVPILAPMGGHLTAKMVYEGASVKAGDLVMRLASRHRMWIDARVHEQQMPLLSDGQPVRATVLAMPGKVFTGKLIFVHPHLDPKTRTALARIEIDNQDLHLREGMYATVEIAADNYREAVVIPAEAVIDTGRRQLAFVDLGNGRFSPRELKLGLQGRSDTVEVLEGLAAGDRVVTSGQFLLDSESRLKEAIAKHLSAGLAGHASHAATPTAVAPAAVAPEVPTPAAPEPAPATPTPPAPVARVAVPHTDDIVRAYLAIADRLGARQAADTRIDPAALADVAAMATAHATDDAKPLAKAVADTATALKGKPLPEQRKAFVELSAAVIALVRASPPSHAVAPTLFVFHCPMAFSDKGADWLQTTDTTANPYYATEMKRCGEVTQRLTAATDGGKP